MDLLREKWRQCFRTGTRRIPLAEVGRSAGESNGVGRCHHRRQSQLHGGKNHLGIREASFGSLRVMLVLVDMDTFLSESDQLVVQPENASLNRGGFAEQTLSYEGAVPVIR